MERPSPTNQNAGFSLSQSCSAGNEVFTIAPGENKHPIHFMSDKHCEEMAFPTLFPTGKFGCQVERDVPLSPAKYFNAILSSYTGRFSNNPEYLFFAQYVTEQKKVQDSINIALKKVVGQSLTAAEVRSMNSIGLQNLIFSDQAYVFMKNIPGSPSYWKRFMYEVIAMIKQLGPPSRWMTLSCADLRWNEIYKILSKLQGTEIADEQIDVMSYDQKCKMLNSNPVVVAKHFQFRLERLFKDLLLNSNDPIGKILYHAIRIEFQFHGSPHAHCFIWISNCPIITEETIDSYLEFLDKYVHAYLPEEVSQPELHHLVKSYQTHAHSKTYRKYKNLPRRFNFGHFFTEKTIVAKPLGSNLDQKQTSDILTSRKCLLTKVKQVIDETLNPSKPSTYNPNRTIKEILESIEINEYSYYEALSIAPGTDNEVHRKRPPNSWFVNNYSPSFLRAW